jgi:hypothetical protein
MEHVLSQETTISTEITQPETVTPNHTRTGRRITPKQKFSPS